MDGISVFGSIFGLARGAFGAIFGVFGLVAPKLDLTFEPGKAPYVESDQTMTWVVEPVPDSSNSTATQCLESRNWRGRPHVTYCEATSATTRGPR